MPAFDFRARIDKIILAGLGGTGSQVARSVARILYDMRSRGLDTPSLTFVDPDTIEQKNIGRQVFTPAHIGMSKAEVLAASFNMALGLDIEAISAPYHRDMCRAHSPSLLIGCVDNHHARQELHDSGGLWLDCGNEYSSGQVVIGTLRDIKHFWRRWRNDDDDLFDLPAPSLIFPSLLEPEEATPTPDLSCADLMITGDQHLLINEYVALAASQYVYKLLHRQKLRSFMTFVDSEAMYMRPIEIERDTIAAYIPSPIVNY